MVPTARHVASSCADEKWVFDPDMRCCTANKLDPAYMVQVQLQMHVTGAKKAFLGQWTLRNGTAVFQLDYSREFMRRASKVLKLVFDKYVAPSYDCDSQYGLPERDIMKQPYHLRTAWENMMHSLADVVQNIKQLTVEGVPTLGL
jgi:hypothetical protein